MKLAEYAAKYKITLAELARRVGVPRTSLALICKGEGCTLLSAHKIMVNTHGEVSYDDLLQDMHPRKCRSRSGVPPQDAVHSPDGPGTDPGKSREFHGQRPDGRSGIASGQTTLPGIPVDESPDLVEKVGCSTDAEPRIEDTTPLSPRLKAIFFGEEAPSVPPSPASEASGAGEDREKSP